MLLAQQVQAILYHFLMGWIYGCTFSFLCSLTVSIRLPLLKSCLEIIYHICFTLFVYYGLYQINGGITNLYLIVVFLFAVMIYYRDANSLPMVSSFASTALEKINACQKENPWYN